MPVAFPQVFVTTVVRDQGGNPVMGAVVSARLSTVERHNGYVIPSEFSGRTNERGECRLAVFPNQLGTEKSEYVFTITTPDGKSTVLRATVPNADCYLHDITELEPYKPRGVGQIVSAEVAGNAVAAGEAAKEAKKAADRASELVFGPDGRPATADLIGDNALALALKAAESAESAREWAESPGHPGGVVGGKSAKRWSDEMVEVSNYSIFRVLALMRRGIGDLEKFNADIIRQVHELMHRDLKELFPELEEYFRRLETLAQNSERNAILRITAIAKTAMADIDALRKAILSELEHVSLEQILRSVPEFADLLDEFRRMHGLIEGYHADVRAWRDAAGEAAEKALAAEGAVSAKMALLDDALRRAEAAVNAAELAQRNASASEEIARECAVRSCECADLAKSYYDLANEALENGIKVDLGDGGTGTITLPDGPGGTGTIVITPGTGQGWNPGTGGVCPHCPALGGGSGSGSGGTTDTPGAPETPPTAMDAFVWAMNDAGDLEPVMAAPGGARDPDNAVLPVRHSLGGRTPATPDVQVWSPLPVPTFTAVLTSPDADALPVLAGSIDAPLPVVARFGSGVELSGGLAPVIDAGGALVLSAVGAPGGDIVVGDDGSGTVPGRPARPDSGTAGGSGTTLPSGGSGTTGGVAVTDCCCRIALDAAAEMRAHIDAYNRLLADENAGPRIRRWMEEHENSTTES